MKPGVRAGAAVTRVAIAGGGLGSASRVQQGSYARADYNHLPDGPEQRARDEALRVADPLAANAWIYAYDR